MDLSNWKKIKFGDRVIAQRGEKYTILHDVNHNKTVRITTESYHVVNDVCENEWELTDVLSECESEEDKIYLLNILDYLAENSIIREQSDDTEYKDIDIRIDLDITNRCNLRCKHCCVSADIHSEDLSTDFMIDIVNKIGSLNPKVVVISGGEPLVRRDFKVIIDELKKNYHGYLALMTNAVLMTEDLADYISRNFDTVSISLDGVDEETCSAIRGKGVFDKTIKGIKMLQNAGMNKISVSMIVSKATYNKKQEFKKLCQDLGVEPMFRSLGLIGRAEKEMKDMLPPYNEEIEYEREQIKIDDVDKKVKNDENVPRPFFSCSAAYKQFQIDYRGVIFPCQTLMIEEMSLGNILDIADFNEYIRERKFVNTDGYKVLEQYFPYNFKDCRNCNKQLLCWSCVWTLYREQKRHEGCEQCQQVFEKFLK